MSCILFYFSGTGNTKWAAAQMQNALDQLGQPCHVYSIEHLPSNLAQILKESDMLGIAFPVYAMNMPPIMHDFIHSIGPLLLDRPAPIPLFVLITAGFADGCGPREAANQFPPHTVVLVGYAGLIIASNAETPAAKPHPLPQGELASRLAAADAKIATLAKSIAEGKKNVPSGAYNFIFFRKIMRRFPRKAYKLLSIHTETCIRCLACLHNCPTSSIYEKEDGFEFLPSCTACLRCYNFCPTASIWHNGRFADPTLYKRYRGPST